MGARGHCLGQRDFVRYSAQKNLGTRHHRRARTVAHRGRHALVCWPDALLCRPDRGSAHAYILREPGTPYLRGSGDSVETGTIGRWQSLANSTASSLITVESSFFLRLKKIRPPWPLLRRFLLESSAHCTGQSGTN